MIFCKKLSKCDTALLCGGLHHCKVVVHFQRTIFIIYLKPVTLKHIFFSLDAAGCDITLTVTDTIQYIATENYPVSYRNNQNCLINFVAPSGWSILFRFEHSDLEIGFDFLHLRKLCNLSLEHFVESISNYHAFKYFTIRKSDTFLSDYLIDLKLPRTK